MIMPSFLLLALLIAGRPADQAPSDPRPVPASSHDLHPARDLGDDLFSRESATEGNLEEDEEEDALSSGTCRPIEDDGPPVPVGDLRQSPPHPPDSHRQQPLRAPPRP